MNRGFFIRGGLVVLFLFSAYSLSEADEEVREVVLTSRVEQGEKIWSPLKIYAKKGETIKIRLVNRTEVVHGFVIEEFKIKEKVFGGLENEITFKVKKRGTFRYLCFIHRAHKGGELIVE